MSKIEDLLSEHHGDRIDYDNLIKDYPWIVEKNRYCVLSPDSDGLLCGLFMSKVLGWKVVGFYDDKVAVINKDYLREDVVFLDGEIYRKEIKSFGHHMVSLNKRNIHPSWENFDECIQPNNLRNYDGKNDFRLKYPLATIHMLVSIVAYKYRGLKIPQSAIPALFFTDGVFNVLFSYPENVLNWLKYLRIDEDWNPLKDIFESKTYSVFELMNEMNEFFRMRDSITQGKERGDRLKISNKDGSPYNILGIGTNGVHIEPDAVERICKFMKTIGEQTTWDFDENSWDCWDNLKYYKFTKRDFQGDEKTLTISNFFEMLDKKPLSWAMTSGQNIEYTLEEPDFFEINMALVDYLEEWNKRHPDTPISEEEMDRIRKLHKK